jgi:hypothetical protein
MSDNEDLGDLIDRLDNIRYRISNINEDLSELQCDESILVNQISCLTGGCKLCRNSHYPHCKVE